MKLREEFEVLVDAFIAANGLSKGTVPVSIQAILEALEAFSDGTVPVSKAMLGRALTKRFLKKQSKKTLEQQYFLNKSV